MAGGCATAHRSPLCGRSTEGEKPTQDAENTDDLSSHLARFLGLRRPGPARRPPTSAAPQPAVGGRAGRAAGADHAVMRPGSRRHRGLTVRPIMRADQMTEIAWLWGFGCYDPRAGRNPALLDSRDLPSPTQPPERERCPNRLSWVTVLRAFR